MKLSIQYTRQIKKLLKSYDIYTLHFDKNGKSGYIIMNDLSKIYFASENSTSSNNIKLIFQLDYNGVFESINNTIIKIND